MKKVLLGTGIGIGIVTTSVVATIVSMSVIRKVKKEQMKDNDRLSEDLSKSMAEVVELKSRLDGLEDLIQQNNLMMEQNKADRELIKREKENIELENAKIVNAKRTILDSVGALKNAMYCNDTITRDQLVEKNCENITQIITRIDRQMEFYRLFAGYGKDFAWVEGNVKAVQKRLEDKPGDLESTMQLLGYEEKEKQILRWYFAA